MTRGLQNRSRRAIACALAYAFALQGFIFALDIGNAAFAAANGVARAGFELCIHGGPAPKQSDVPTQSPTGNVHCILCMAGAVFLNSAPPAPPDYREALLSSAMAPLSVPHLVAVAVIESAWPRGPPAAA